LLDFPLPYNVLTFQAMGIWVTIFIFICHENLSSSDSNRHDDTVSPSFLKNVIIRM
jgi:hypothetical protein